MAGCISIPCRGRSSSLLPLLGALLLASVSGKAAESASDPASAGRVTAVRFWSLGDMTRIAIEVSSEFHFKYERLSNPDRLYFDLLGATPEITTRAMQIIHVDDGIIKQIRVAETQPGVTRVVVDLQQPASLSTSQLTNPGRLMIEVRSSEAKSSRAASGEVKPASDRPNSSGSASEKTVAVAAVTFPPVTPSPLDAGPALIPVTRAAVSRPGEPLTKTTSQTVSNAVSTIAMAHVNEVPRLPEAAKSSDAKAVRASSGNGGSRVPNFGERAEGVPQNPVPNPLSNAASLASEPGVLLPPEPLGVEPLYHNDVKHDDVKHDDVKEVLPAKRGIMDDRSLTRALGLKLGRVVIDPGHGGRDVGTHGPSGYFEKDLVLDVSRRLAALIQDRTASEVVLTRSDDTYVGLEERTRIANERKADLFLSIHANSSSYRAAAGVETYVLSFTTSKAAMDLASRENAGSGLAIHDLQDLLQKIALRDKIDESRELAARLQKSLSVLSTNSNDAAKNRGVKKAPFVVLIGANMPSVLAEIGFLSNASDEALLRKPEHRQKIAEALYKGISAYADTLSQVIARQN